MRRGGWLRPAAACCGLLALLSGCAYGPGARPDAAEPAAPEKPARVLRLTVGSELGMEVLDQADAFAARVEALSRGRMKLEVVTGYPDAGTLTAGESDLCFLSNHQMAAAEEVFAMFSLPFLYDDGDHLSRALNSQDLLGPLGERLEGRGLTPLAAFYRGSSFLVTDSRALRAPADFKDLPLVIGADSAEKLSVFEFLGARVIPYPAAQVPSMLGRRVEVLPDDLSRPDDRLTVEAVELSLQAALDLPGAPSGRNLILSYHTASPLWLAARTEALDALSGWERAVLDEARAGLLYDLGEAAARRERALLDELEGAGMRVVAPERPQIAKAIYEDGAYTLPGYFDRRLYDRVQQFL